VRGRSACHVRVLAAAGRMRGWREVAAAAESINAACVRWDERERGGGGDEGGAGLEGRGGGEKKRGGEGGRLWFSHTFVVLCCGKFFSF
jgi:hypothetical protein